MYDNEDVQGFPLTRMYVLISTLNGFGVVACLGIIITEQARCLLID